MIIFIKNASHCSFQGKWNNALEREEKMPHCNELGNKKRKRPSPVRIPVPNDLYKLRYRHRPSHAWNSNWDNYTLLYIAAFQLSIVKSKFNDWNLSLLQEFGTQYSWYSRQLESKTGFMDSLIDSATNSYDNIYNIFMYYCTIIYHVFINKTLTFYDPLCNMLNNKLHGCAFV